MRLTIDTFAWLELIRGGAPGRRVRNQLEVADSCLCPSIVLAEIASKLTRLGVPDLVIDGQFRAIREASQIIPIDDEIALAGAHAREELQMSAREQRAPLPGLADGLILATARLTRSRLLTGDPHFRHCPETIWLE